MTYENHSLRACVEIDLEESKGPGGIILITPLS